MPTIFRSEKKCWQLRAGKIAANTAIAGDLTQDENECLNLKLVEF